MGRRTHLRHSLEPVMYTIFKYQLDPSEEGQTITAPAPANPIHVGLDAGGIPCIWLEVEEDSDTSYDVRVYVVGTGTEIPVMAGEYVGTFIQGLFVWHIYVHKEL